MKKVLFGAATIIALLSFAPAADAADPAPSESTPAVQPGPAGAADTFVAHINTLRASLGLTSLSVDTELTAKANAWARTQAEAGRIWHSTLSDGITADWAYLGENVGMGGSVDSLHQAFVRSPHHYDNLVRPDFERVGIGLAQTGGTLFVTEVFMKLQPPAAPVPPAPAPAAVTPTPPATAPSAALRRPVVRQRPTVTPAPTVNPTLPVPAMITLPTVIPDRAVPVGAAPSAPVEVATMPVRLQTSPISATTPADRRGATALALIALGAAAAALTQRPTFRRSKRTSISRSCNTNGVTPGPAVWRHAQTERTGSG